MPIGKKKFWLIWNPYNLNLPQRTFDDLDLATTELEKLSDSFPGLEFYVMESTKYATVIKNKSKAAKIN